MGKLPKVKARSTTNPRSHSRAARRASSPVDKSLQSIPHAHQSITTTTGASTNTVPTHRPTGILKKRKIKHLTRGQRMRQTRDLERAATVRDQQDMKIQSARGRSKKVHSRRAGWEDINDASREEVRKGIKAPGWTGGMVSEKEAEEEEKRAIEAFEGDTEIKVLDGVQVPAFAAGTKMTMTVGGLTMGRGRPVSKSMAVATDEIT